MAQYAKVGDSGDPWVSGFRNRQLLPGEANVTPVDLGRIYRELVQPSPTSPYRHFLSFGDFPDFPRVGYVSYMEDN